MGKIPGGFQTPCLPELLCWRSCVGAGYLDWLTVHCGYWFYLECVRAVAVRVEELRHGLAV